MFPLIVSLIFLVFTSSTVLAMRCHSCQQGCHKSFICERILPTGIKDKECKGPNPQCFEALEWYGNGSFKSVRRGCWSRPNNGTDDFCRRKIKKHVFKYCKTCTEDLCNSGVIDEPIKFFCSNPLEHSG